MNKIIQRTTTLTMTESWAIVWSTEDEPLRSATRVVQDNSESQEEQDETHRSICYNCGRSRQSYGNAAHACYWDGSLAGRQTIRSTGGSKRKRARARPAEGNP